MKIALLNIMYYPFVEGGAEVSTQKLAEELAKEHEVSVICHGETPTKEVIHGVTVCRIPGRTPLRSKIERVLTENYNMHCYRQLKDTLKEIRPDVLHTNNLHRFSVIVWKAARELNIPIVHTLRDYTLIECSRLHERYLIRHCSNYVTAVTAPSEFTLHTFLEANLFKKAGRKMAIPNAIDVDADAIQSIIDQKIQMENTPVKFAYLGRFSEEKGVDWLIRVFDSMETDMQLHLFGKGKLKRESLDILRKNDRVIDRGFLTQEALREALTSIDVVVVPSLWEEPFGRVILDAYVSGCPVITTSRGGMPEVVLPMKTGIILEREENACLASAMHYFEDRTRIKEMLKNLGPYVSNYGVDIQAKAFTALYREAMERS